jgi:hypothetical protein
MAASYHFESRLPGGCFTRGLQIFGFLLLVAAVFRISLVVRYAWDAVRMRDWDEAPAAVLEAEYKELPDASGPQVFAKYTYRYGGREYDGTRVDVANNPELFGDLQKQMADRLQQHINDKTQSVAYVNPDNPAESVLDRDFYPSVFAFRLGFFVILLVIGGLLVAGSAHVRRKQSEQARVQQGHPNQPWMWRPDWAAGVIRSSRYRLAGLAAWIFAIYLLVILPLSLWIIHHRGNEILSWPGIVVIVLAWGLFNLARMQLKGARMFRGAEFRMSSVPGVIGGPLAGVMVVKNKFPEDTKYRVVVECAKTDVIEVSSDDDRFEETIPWREQLTVERTLSVPDPNVTAIPVYVAIPFDCEPSASSPRHKVRWWLKVGPEATNFERFVQFEVPVYKTADSSPTFKPDLEVMRPYEAPVDVPNVLSRLCRVTILPDGIERMRFSYVEAIAVFAALIIIAACGGGIAALLYYDFHPAWTILPAIFGFVMTLGLMEMVLWSGIVDIGRDDLTVTAGLLGLRKRFTLSRSQIAKSADIETKKELAMQTRDWYALDLKITLPRKEGALDDDLSCSIDRTLSLRIVRRLETCREADALGDWLREKLGPVGK